MPRSSRPPKQTATSRRPRVGAGSWDECAAVAHVSASTRFCRASLRGSWSGSWLPVSTMGLPKPASISESADAT